MKEQIDTHRSAHATYDEAWAEVVDREMVRLLAERRKQSTEAAIAREFLAAIEQQTEVIETLIKKIHHAKDAADISAARRYWAAAKDCRYR